MDLLVAISSKPLENDPSLHEPASDQNGATVEFKGIVRREEAGSPIAALEYEAYQPMAEIMMRRIATELGAQHPCDRVLILHRIGIVPVGEAAIVIRATAKHRAEAFAFVARFMDRLKQDVPIWKVRGVPLPVKLAPANSGKQPPGFSEVLATIDAACQPLTTERVALANAAGRVLRETITAPEDQPAFSRSAVDGMAIRLDDSSESFAVIDEIRAGDWRPRQLQPGEAVRISTGGALPCAGLRVVMIEDVELSGNRCRVQNRSSETHIRVQGEDVRRGELLLAPGTGLTAGTISLLAGIGVPEPLVTRQPSIIHFTTGDELVPAQQTPGPGQIRDSNTPLVAAFLQQLGLAVTHHHLPENFDQAKAELARHTSEISAVDILIFSGGASVGAHDHTPKLLELFGFELKIRGTRLRPGKPLLFATSGPRIAFGLPGNPLAHFVGLLGFVRAAIAKLAGTTAPGLQVAVLTSPLEADGNPRETLWPASLSLRDGMLLAEPLSWRNSGNLVALARTNGLILLAPGTGLLERSASVNVLACALFP